MRETDVAQMGLLFAFHITVASAWLERGLGSPSIISTHIVCSGREQDPADSLTPCSFISVPFPVVQVS